jgi:hypothetical protein
VFAQGAAGHWEGAIAAPMGDVLIELDLASDAEGALIGTFSNVSKGLKGFPFSNVTIEGRAMRLEIAANRGNETFRGTLSEDGATIAGEFLISVYAVPFRVTRTGEARIAPAPRNSAIDKALEGTWRGTLEIEGQALPVVVTLTNRVDRTAAGTWSTDGGAALPLSITDDGGRLTLASPAGLGTYVGVVNGARTEMSGTLTSGEVTASLTLTRSDAADGR